MITTSKFRPTTESFAQGSRTLPQSYLVAPEIFEQELARIFSRHWICLGHTSDLTSAGDFFLAEVARESFIVVRGRDDSIRAFYNVCRHRGTRLCEEERGRKKTLQCPYHAWTYALDGKLIGAPQMEEVGGFRFSDYGLNEVTVGTWEGLIFANLSEKAPALTEYFAPLAGKFAHWSIPRLRSARRIRYEVAANWKLILENYSECYHCPLVHPPLQKLTPFDSAENDLVDGPFLGGFMEITAGRSLTMSGKSCARPVGQITENDHTKVFYYSIFPNLLLSMHPDYVMVHKLWPQSPDRTIVDCDWYFHAEAFGVPDFRPDDAIEFWDMTNRQDWNVCELSQRGISSRSYRPGPYSARESIPAAWDREYLRQLGEL